MVKFNPKDSEGEGGAGVGREPDLRNKAPVWEDEKGINDVVPPKGRNADLPEKDNYTAGADGTTNLGYDAHQHHIPKDTQLLYLLVNDAIHRETFFYYKEEDTKVRCERVLTLCRPPLVVRTV